MMWPSVDNERAAALKALRLPVENADGWKRYRIPMQITFFILTMIGIGTFSGFALLNRTVGSTFNAVVVFAIAEYLILKHRFFATGVETALWLAGVVFVILALPQSGETEGLLVIGAIVGIAGARLLNPLIGGLAAMSVIIYVDAKHASPLQTVLVALAIAILASAAQIVEWRRRSVERLFQTIAIFAPLAGVIAAEFGSSIDHGALASCFAAAAVIVLAIAISQRARALLIAGALSAAIALFEASYLSNAGVEAKLIVSGVLLVAIAVLLSRALRGRTSGFVITPSSLTGYDEAMQIAGAIPVTPSTSAPATSDGFHSGGGNFGGGGASAGY